MVDNWYNGLYSYIDSVPSDQDVEQVFGKHFSKMTWTFREGKWVFISKFNRNLFLLKENLRKSFAALLMPTTWKLVDRATWVRPVIFMKNENCWQ
jgi:hypothetical protein